MNYRGQQVGRGRTPFRKEREYTYQQLFNITHKVGLKLVRPNGDPRVRGSRRLLVVDPASRDARLWSFTAVENADESTTVMPVPLGRL